MNCFTCKNKIRPSSYYPSITPDRYKIRCYRCEGLNNEGAQKIAISEASLENGWIPPPMPPTRKQAQEWEAYQRREESERKMLEDKRLWDKQHETTCFNMLVHPPINYGGPGEGSIIHLPRICTFSISDPHSITEPTSFEARKKKYRKKREKKLLKLLANYT